MTPELARAQAIVWHGEQKYGEHPYVKHLDEVAEIARPFGAVAEMAAYLHDAVEDTGATLDDIEKMFGQDVASVVGVVTDPPGKNRKQRKRAAYERLAAIPTGSSLGIALVVKAADRLANVRACVREKNDRLLLMYRKEHPAFGRAVRGVLSFELVRAVTTLFVETLPSVDTATLIEIYTENMRRYGPPPPFDAPLTLRVWDGMDGCWTDVLAGEADEVLRLWYERTSAVSNATNFDDIDYYRLFPETKKMFWNGEDGRELPKEDAT